MRKNGTSLLKHCQIVMQKGDVVVWINSFWDRAFTGMLDRDTLVKIAEAQANILP
jgi:hypothetical protein